MAISDYNFYDFVFFPNRETRVKAKKEYFDVLVLRLNTEKYCENNPKEPAVLKWDIEDILESDDNRRRGFRESIRRINNQLCIADITLLSLYAYYDKMKKYKNDETGKYALTEILFRDECMRASFELYSVQEKYKTVLRELYHVDSETTKKYKDFRNAIIEASGNSFRVEKFFNVCNKVFQHDDYKKVIKIRTDETHNVPCLDDVIFCKKTAMGGVAFGQPYYSISSDELYSSIKNAYNELINVRDIVQEIIDNYKE